MTRKAAAQLLVVRVQARFCSSTPTPGPKQGDSPVAPEQTALTSADSTDLSTGKTSGDVAPRSEGPPLQEPRWLHISKFNRDKDAPNTVGEVGFEIELSKSITEREKNEIAKKNYDPNFIYARTGADGTSDIIWKHNPPDNPTAHIEGPFLDFSDSADHPMKSNPYGQLAAEAKSGNWEGVNKFAIGVPSKKQKSPYGFERRNKYALTNYGRTTDYISATPAEIDASSILEFAAARLPGFDETRESIFDKMALRNYVERRDLRVLEREHLRLQRQMQEFQSETMLQVARDLRRGDVRDLVMQGTSKWLGLKHWESHEANVLQNEDIKWSNHLARHIFFCIFSILIAVVAARLVDDGSLQNVATSGTGELSSISGNVDRSDSFGSYKQVGDMHRFQDRVTKYRINATGGDVVTSRINDSFAHVRS